EEWRAGRCPQGPHLEPKKVDDVPRVVPKPRELLETKSEENTLVKPLLQPAEQLPQVVCENSSIIQTKLDDTSRPIWDQKQKQLRMGKCSVPFKKVEGNHAKVLDAFQECGWSR